MAEEKVSTPAPQAETPPAPDLKVEATTTPKTPEVESKAAPTTPAPAKEPETKVDAAPKPEGKAEGKSETPSTEKPPAPEKYELKLPDNTLLEPAHVEQITAYAKQNGLSNADAQKFLEERSIAIQEATNVQAAAWEKEALNDPEIGGGSDLKLKENAEFAKRAVDAYGSQKLKDVLNKTGTGNHPELIRMLSKIGRAIGEDKAVLPRAQVGKTEKTAAEIMYGEQA